jgi:hypothetical protein
MPSSRLRSCRLYGGRFPATIAALAVMLALIPGAAESALYKWVDANGRVSYSDQPPPGNVKSEVFNAAVAPSDSEAVRAMANQEAEFKKRQSQRVDDQQKAEKARQDQATQKEACTSARGQIKMFDSGVPMQRFNEKGEPVYMDEGMKARERSRIEALIREKCAA